MRENSKIIRCQQYRWTDTPKRIYKTGESGFRDITRQVLLGERADENDLNAQTRYFELSPGGYSSLERHQHTHTVIVIRGSGSMILGNRIEELGFLDTIYISPGTVHQFHADKEDYLGFICVVDRTRDRPAIPLNEADLARWITDPEVRRKAKI